MGAKVKDTRTFANKMIRLVVEGVEATYGTKIISYEEGRGGVATPGGMCSCCGAGPRVAGPDDWWLVLKAGFTDGDGIYMGQLCQGPDGDGCYAELKAAKDAREAKGGRRFRDEAAEMLSDLLGDDIDGAQAMFEDFDMAGEFDGFDELED